MSPAKIFILFSLYLLSPFFSLGFYVILIYLTVLGLSRGMQHLCSIMWDLGSVIIALGLPCRMQDLSCLIRDRTSLPCIARQILSHWTAMAIKCPHCSIFSDNVSGQNFHFSSSTSTLFPRSFPLLSFYCPT